MTSVITKELLEKLILDYSPDEPSPCRVCNAELHIMALEPNKITYGCQKPPGVTYGEWDSHYRDSQVFIYKMGDSRVVSLATELLKDLEGTNQ